MYNLLEDNKSIEGYITYLDQLIVKLRTTKGIDEELKKELLKFYETLIHPWTKKYYLSNKEISENDEKEMIDIILDKSNEISKLINEK
jgi:hypothetical protein